MPRKPDVPCAGGCGNLLHRGSKSLANPTCQPCRSARRCSVAGCKSAHRKNGMCSIHAERAYRKAAYKPVSPWNPCTDCGCQTMAVKNAAGRFCEECAAERKRKRESDKCRRRRVLTLGRAIDYYTFDEIYERDNGQCHLCEKPVALEIRFPHRMSGEIDHVIPISKGGDDTRGNVKLAHRICNLLKSDSLERILING